MLKSVQKEETFEGIQEEMTSLNSPPDFTCKVLELGFFFFFRFVDLLPVVSDSVSCEALKVHSDPHSVDPSFTLEFECGVYNSVIKAL